MRRILAIFGFVAFVTMSVAQEADVLNIPAPKPIVPQTDNVGIPAEEGSVRWDAQKASPVGGGMEGAPVDSLHLPVLNRYGQLPYIGLYPMSWGGMYDWQLHEGLNVNLGASVFTSLGRNTYHGAGFQQNVSLMYAVPVNDRLSLAIGGYLNNLTWHHDNFRDAGLSAVLGYRFDNHWEGYLYAQKSLSPNRRLMSFRYNDPIYGRMAFGTPFYDFAGMGDRIGAAVRYNFSPSFSVQVAVEQRSY